MNNQNAYLKTCLNEKQNNLNVNKAGAAIHLVDLNAESGIPDKPEDEEVHVVDPVVFPKFCLAFLHVIIAEPVFLYVHFPAVSGISFQQHPFVILYLFVFRHQPRWYELRSANSRAMWVDYKC